MTTVAVVSLQRDRAATAIVLDVDIRPHIHVEAQQITEIVMQGRRR